MIALRFVEIFLFWGSLSAASFLVVEGFLSRIVVSLILLCVAIVVVVRFAKSSFVHLMIFVFCVLVLFVIPNYLPWLARQNALG